MLSPSPESNSPLAPLSHSNQVFAELRIADTEIEIHHQLREALKIGVPHCLAAISILKSTSKELIAQLLEKYIEPINFREAVSSGYFSVYSKLLEQSGQLDRKDRIYSEVLEGKFFHRLYQHLAVDEAKLGRTDISCKLWDHLLGINYGNGALQSYLQDIKRYAPPEYVREVAGRLAAKGLNKKAARAILNMLIDRNVDEAEELYQTILAGCAGIKNLRYQDAMDVNNLPSVKQVVLAYSKPDTSAIDLRIQNLSTEARELLLKQIEQGVTKPANLSGNILNDFCAWMRLNKSGYIKDSKLSGAISSAHQDIVEVLEKIPQILELHKLSIPSGVAMHMIAEFGKFKPVTMLRITQNYHQDDTAHELSFKRMRIMIDSAPVGLAEKYLVAEVQTQAQKLFLLGAAFTAVRDYLVPVAKIAWSALIAADLRYAQAAFYEMLKDRIFPPENKPDVDRSSLAMLMPAARLIAPSKNATLLTHLEKRSVRLLAAFAGNWPNTFGESFSNYLAQLQEQSLISRREAIGMNALYKNPALLFEKELENIVLVNSVVLHPKNI